MLKSTSLTMVFLLALAAPALAQRADYERHLNDAKTWHGRMILSLQVMAGGVSIIIFGFGGSVLKKGLAASKEDPTKRTPTYVTAAILFAVGIAVLLAAIFWLPDRMPFEMPKRF